MIILIIVHRSGGCRKFKSYDTEQVLGTGIEGSPMPLAKVVWSNFCLESFGPRSTTWEVALEK